MPQRPDSLVAVGKIAAVHGIKGWVKVHSYTEPEENIFAYQPWWLQMGEGWQELRVDQCRPIERGFLAHIENVDDRDVASHYCQREILVDPGVFGQLAASELYWHQLQGLTVISTFAGRRQRLGKVESLMETGANDVLVVRGDAESIDRKERLLPFVDAYIGRIDTVGGELEIDWDPEF